jgi:dienelactone hydrolase
MPSIEPVRVDAGDVPALLFVPDGSEPLPLVLLGHGAHLGKDVDVMQILCRSFARNVPAAVLIIDCPGHGERRPPDLEEAAWDALVQRHMGSRATHDELVGDWTAAAAAARAIEPRIDDRTGYAGFSMGSIYGASIVHRLEFVGPVVLALGGFVGAHRDRGVNERIEAGLVELGPREVLMLNMTRDESFPIDDALRAFALIPGPKRMAVYEGGHVDIPGEAIRLAADFLRRTLV